MADRYAANIYIGGKVPRSKIEGLVFAINEQGCRLAWGDDRIDLGDPEDDLDGCIQKLKDIAISNTDGQGMNRPDSKGRLWFRDDRARWGQFEELETYCLKNDIAFDRDSESYCEYNAELVRFRSGMKAPDVQKVSDDGNPQVDVDYIKPVLEVIKELGKTIESPGGFNSNDILLNYRKLSAEADNLKNQMPMELPELEPFEIVDDEPDTEE